MQSIIVVIVLAFIIGACFVLAVKNAVTYGVDHFILWILSVIMTAVLTSRICAL